MITRRSGILAIKVLYALAISTAIYVRIHGAIFPFLLPILLASAFIWGGREERLVAGTLVITLEVLTVGPLLHFFAHSFDVAGSRLGVTVIGATYLAIVLMVAVGSEKWWPSWVAALQLLLVVSHPLFAMMRSEIEPWAYASGIVIWSWLQLIAISFGIFDGWTARREARPSG